MYGAEGSADCWPSFCTNYGVDTAAGQAPEHAGLSYRLGNKKTNDVQ